MIACCDSPTRRVPGWRLCSRAFLLALLCALQFTGPAHAQAPAGETLYNGIQLPAAWPPHPAAFPAYNPPPPYLLDPPSVIPIDVGRQLFVDDFLIESTTMNRTFHQPVYHPSNPLVFPDRPWEGGYALAYSDGVFYDPSDQLFKMWYMAGDLRDHTALAVSTEWHHVGQARLRRAGWHQRRHTRIGRDSNSVWLDHYEADPSKRFKTAWWYGGMHISSSADGIHWGPTEFSSGTTGDRSTFFYNPFRRKWVFSLRSADSTSPELIDTRRYGRVRRYAEGATLAEAAQTWPGHLGEDTLINLPKWLSADVDDLPTRHPHFNPQLYNLDAAAYESLVVGFFTILTADTAADRPKINEVSLGYSRDGFHFSRPDRRPFFAVSEDPGAWNYGNVQSTAGGGIVVGDEIYFYLTGRTLDQASTGLAVLRRDGFASMDAGSSAEPRSSPDRSRFAGKISVRQRGHDRWRVVCGGPGPERSGDRPVHRRELRSGHRRRHRTADRVGRCTRPVGSERAAGQVQVYDARREALCLLGQPRHLGGQLRLPDGWRTRVPRGDRHGRRECELEQRPAVRVPHGPDGHRQLHPPGDRCAGCQRHPTGTERSPSYSSMRTGRWWDPTARHRTTPTGPMWPRARTR